MEHNLDHLCIIITGGFDGLKIGFTTCASRASAGDREAACAWVLRQSEPEPVPVSLAHSGQGVLPLKLRAFLDFAAPRLKARLSVSAP